MFAVLENVAEFNAFLQKSNNQVLLVKFSAPWCMPCKRLQTEIEKLEKTNIDSKQNLLVLEIDIEKIKIPDLVKETKITEFEVKSIPSLFLFHQGKLKKNNQDYGKIRAEFSHLSLLEQLKEFIKL